MKRNYTTLGIGLLLILIFLAILSAVQVRQSTVVVITTFGKPTRTLKDPGLYWKLPIPIQWAHTFDQRIQNFDDKLDQAMTADNFTLLTMVYAGWQINDAQAFFPKFENGSVSEAEKALTGIIRSAKSAVVGKHPLSDFVSTDQNQIKFDQIEKEILTIVQDQVNQKNYGIKMEFLGIKKLGFPEAVTQEVFKRMTSERELLSSAITAEGNKEASNIRAEASGKSAQVIANAEAQATQIKAEGQAEAAKSFAVFQQNPTLANFLLDLNALDLSMRDRTTLIFDQHSEPFNLFQGFSTNLYNPSPKQ